MGVEVYICSDHMAQAVAGLRHAEMNTLVENIKLDMIAVWV